jgi:hypothetical protein
MSALGQKQTSGLFDHLVCAQAERYESGHAGATVRCLLSAKKWSCPPVARTPGEVARTASPTFGLSLRWSTPGSKPASPLAPCDSDHDQSRHEHDENKQA